MVRIYIKDHVFLLLLLLLLCVIVGYMGASLGYNEVHMKGFWDDGEYEQKKKKSCLYFCI
jgi:hypothetical protein